LEGIKAHGRIGRGPLETVVYGTDLSVDESPGVGGHGSGSRASWRTECCFGSQPAHFRPHPASAGYIGVPAFAPVPGNIPETPQPASVGGHRSLAAGAVGNSFSARRFRTSTSRSTPLRRCGWLTTAVRRTCEHRSSSDERRFSPIVRHRLGGADWPHPRVQPTHGTFGTAPAASIGRTLGCSRPTGRSVPPRRRRLAAPSGAVDLSNRSVSPRRNRLATPSGVAHPSTRSTRLRSRRSTAPSGAVDPRSASAALVEAPSGAAASGRSAPLRRRRLPHLRV